MIEKNEIEVFANKLGISAQTIEKDYVLSWLLWGIFSCENLRASWVFKGGTSLKKCFFETYRFSEDLDFTVIKKSQISQEFLQTAIGEVVNKVHDFTGIKFYSDQFKFKLSTRNSVAAVAQIKVHYNGPLQRQRSVASIKLDLTSNEVLVLSPIKKTVHHPYSDNPTDNIQVQCYSFEEVIAEKIRALAQRARPRDLYDVVNYFRIRRFVDSAGLIHEVLKRKCEFRNIALPNYQDIKNHEKFEELESEWANMLAHQLPYLPPIESFWEDLEQFFKWLNGHQTEKNKNFKSSKDEVLYAFERIVGSSPLECVIQKVQFAITNKILLSLKYDYLDITVEPLYLSRQIKTQEILLYGKIKQGSNLQRFFLSRIDPRKLFFTT